MQCGMLIGGTPDTPEVAGDGDFSVNRGALCIKGWTSAGALAHPDRLTSPLVRNADGALEPATWDEALDRIAESIRSLQARYGKDAIGVFGSGALTNEKAYLLGKFARVALGTRHIDYNGRFCMASAAAAANAAFGTRSRAAVSRSPTSPRPRPSSWSAATSPRRCRRPCSTSTRSAAPAAT